MVNEPFVFPAPEKTELLNGEYSFCGRLAVNIPDEIKNVFGTAVSLFPELDFVCASDGDIMMKKADGLPTAGYRIAVRSGGIEAEYGDKTGAFYAVITLCQLLSRDSPIRCCRIADSPGLKIRGVMMDISRGKVPKLKTLKCIADRLAMFKMNHFELYIEGLSFAYPSYRELWQNETPLTPEEFRELNAYCEERFIDLVPCQNGLGHMGRWLSFKQFKDFAECPDGFGIAGLTFPPTTLDTVDARGFEFVKGLWEELLPCFDSSFANACLDEPFELCIGKNKGADKYRFYTDYANRMKDYLKSRGKRMMMWGDVTAKQDGALDRLDGDIVLLDWGYEKEHPYDKRARRIADSAHDFCLCPGTNSWLSFTGMTDNMLSCIRSSADAAYQYSALGIIVTDWGDKGHLQYLPVSWPGVLTAAAYTWNSKGTDKNALARALDMFVFKDEAGVMGTAALDAGNYYKLEEFLLPCRTLASTVLDSGLVTRGEYERSLAFAAKSITFFTREDFARYYLESYENRRAPNGAAILHALSEVSDRLTSAKPGSKDAAMALEEYQNGLLMASVLTEIRLLMLTGETFPALSERLGICISQHRRLWNLRNKEFGCEQGLKPLIKIREKLP